MSKVIDGAVKALRAKLDGETIDGSVKFIIEHEGSIRIDEDGVAPNDAEADCTLHASRDTFEGLLAGDINPTSAFMTGKLKVEGNMGVAMKLGSLLA
ncbi:MAG: SCP2 sterol-binding domain-containing protein [Pseudomonadota bacterium]